MSTSKLGFGIVGPGFIAGVVADALAQAEGAQLVAVSSRRLENAQKFVAARAGVEAVQGFEALLDRDDVGAVYIATPTVTKEAIAMAAIAAGKHVLVDKPFIDRASVLRMTEAASAGGVVFMDATHFVHHPRTAAVQAATAELIGSRRSLHTVFYFPMTDRENIRFDAGQEPMTALGDMGWYSMRAVVEYLRPEGRIAKVMTMPERDPQTGAIVRASGLIGFESGEVSTFDVGFNAGTALMDLQLIGTSGVIEIDDFVLDWTSSFAYKNPDIAAGFVHRAGMATRKEFTFIAAPTKTPQEVRMVETFSDLARSGNATERARFAASTVKTQEYLDALWTAAKA